MNRIVILFSIIIASYFAIGQNPANIEGKIVNNEIALPYISVIIKGSTIGTITDENGTFVLPSLLQDTVVLKVSGMGFMPHEVSLSPDEQNENITIELKKDQLLLDEVLVSGSRVGVLRYLPGAVDIIQPKELKISSPISANEILRNIPGVHVVDEEGAGLRVNIGIRGLDPDKSRNVLVLEDGIPVALAPYGEPEMYYSPNIERMYGIEVLKGNGSILFGPQTVGGVVNYITADPPKDFGGRISLKAGEFGYNNSYFGFGNTINGVGFTINYNRKQAENFGPTRFLLHDLNAKLLVRFSPKSNLLVKLGIYDESSNATYIGITQAMFDEGGNDYLRIAPDDQLDIRRYAVSATHRYSPGDGIQLNTTVFSYTTTRNWRRQDFTYDAGASNLTGIWFGNPDLPEGAIYMRNSNGHRNRTFEVAGIEPRLSYRYDLLNKTSKLDAGIRFLYERAFEQRVNGTKPDAVSGNIRNDETRTGKAFSSFVQNKMLLSDNVTITAGLRSESIWYEREIFRLNNQDTLIENTTNNFAIIPGLGINYTVNDNMGIYTGLHRGYAPPRTKDAISNSGLDLELEAEKSWNFELGLRQKMNRLQAELTAFYMNFSNQIIPVSESSGGAGTGLVNGGATTHKGLEMALSYQMFSNNQTKWSSSIALSGTYLKAEFTDDRFVLKKTGTDAEKEQVFENIKGNTTPYAPEITFTASWDIEYDGMLGMRLTGNYIGEQFADVLNTVDVAGWVASQQNDPDFTYTQATYNGRIGVIEPYFIGDINVWYIHKKTGLEFNFSVKNLLDERYIVTRRPQGIRVGMPRFISGGITYIF